MAAKFTNQMLSPLEIQALSAEDKINYIVWLQSRLMSYQLAFDAVEGKNKSYHRKIK